LAINNSVGVFQQQRQDYAARRAAGAEQQDATPGRIAAQVVLEVTYQPGTVGVVAEDLGTIEAQGIDRAGGFGARRADGGEAKGLFLEGHGDVGAACAGVVAGAEGFDRRREAILVGEDRLVADVLPGLRREQGMDARRLAVADRISKHGVAIGHSVGSQAVGIGEGPGAGDFKDVGVTPDSFGKRGIGCRHAHDAARRFIKQALSR
jgi:hypothetical protein